MFSSLLLTAFLLVQRDRHYSHIASGKVWQHRNSELKCQIPGDLKFISENVWFCLVICPVGELSVTLKVTGLSLGEPGFTCMSSVTPTVLLAYEILLTADQWWQQDQGHTAGSTRWLASSCSTYFLNLPMWTSTLLQLTRVLERPRKAELGFEHLGGRQWRHEDPEPLWALKFIINIRQVDTEGSTIELESTQHSMEV